MPRGSLDYRDDGARLVVREPSLVGGCSVTTGNGVVLSFDPLTGDLLSALAPDSGQDAFDDVLEVKALPGSQAGGPGTGNHRDVEIHLGPMLPALKRLAYARWNARWTPLDVEQPLVMLDIANAAWQAGPGLRLLGFDLFDEHADYLETLLRSESEAGVLSDEVADALRETTASCVAALTEEDPRAGLLVDLASDLVTRPVAPRALQRAGARSRRRPMAADIGAADVDWDSVPARTLHPDDAGILWESEPHGDAIRIAATVRAHPHLKADSAATRQLLLRIFDASSEDPIIVEPLDFIPGDPPRFEARFQIPTPADPNRIGIDVVDARLALSHPPKTGELAVRQALRRSAVRTLAWSRIREMANRVDASGSRVPEADHELGLLQSRLRGLASVDTHLADWCATIAAHPGSILSTPALLSEMIVMSRRCRSDGST